jgi:hypothetical protein
MKDGELSTTAKNIKVITENGQVTLRGPVKNTVGCIAAAAVCKKKQEWITLQNQQLAAPTSSINSTLTNQTNKTTNNLRL